jgi:membrane protein YdbS with pleckstrin-like domain
MERQTRQKSIHIASFWWYFHCFVFLGITSIFLSAGVPFLESPAVLTIPVAIALIIIPPLWQYRKMPHSAYMITNQRLIIKSGISEQDVWFAELDRIKDTLVKIGFVDKILGTGKLYPITAEYPYEPKMRGYSEGGMYR